MKKNDVILIVVLLVVSLAFFVLIQYKQDNGDVVVVKINGKETASYSLSVDGEYKLNNGTNILRIEDGSAWIYYADCPDKICVNQGKINKPGQVITCLPNRLTVTVVSSKNGDELIG